MDKEFTPPSRAAFREAEDFLIEFGCPPHYGGFAPLAMCIAIASGVPDVGRCLVKRIYPAVVRELGLHIKPANLCNRMKSTIEAGFANCDYFKMKKFCGSCLNADEGTLTNAEFIALAAIQVRRRLEDKNERN